MQTVIPLAENVGLKLTIARYYTPNGISIQAKGIEPDIALDDFDPETMKRLRRKAKTVSEADLKNHIESSEEEKARKLEAALDEEKAAETKDSPPRPLDPKDDYQVQQALNHLKSMSFQAPAKTGTM